MNKPTQEPQNRVKISKFAIFPQVSLPVFATSALLIVIFMIFGALFSETAGHMFNAVQSFITTKFGFMFVILMNVALVFCLYIALSGYGDIRLGHQTETPEYSFGSQQVGCPPYKRRRLWQDFLLLW